MPPEGLDDGNATASADLLTVEVLRRRAEELLPVIGAEAAERERERRLPHHQISQLAKSQLYTFRIPKAYGGPGATVREAIGFVIEVAAVDSNIAQAMRPGFAFVETLLATGSEAQKVLWFDRYLAGDVVGNAGWEIGGANGAIATRITREGAHYRVNGSKYYSTGGLFADWIGSMAVDDEGKTVAFTVPRDREGLVQLDDFDTMGQRLTASGTTHLHNVLVYPDETRTPPHPKEQRSPLAPFLQLYLAAVEAGIARNALTDAVHFTRHHARPIKHSTADASVDDPYVQHRVGEIAARAYTAEAVVLRAAEAIDVMWLAELDQVAMTRATIEVAQAQFIAVDSALRAAELVFDVGGASTTQRQHNLDRHWRNARTVANHNPRDWKAAAIGAYLLKGTQPPFSGLF